MHNINFNDFNTFNQAWETQRKKNLEEKLEKIKKETNEKLNKLEDELLGEDYLLRDILEKETLMRSIMASKVPYKKKSIQIPKKGYAVGASLVILASSIKVAPHVIDIVQNIKMNIEQNSVINPEINDFKKSYVEPNVKYNYNPKTEETIHWHEPMNIVMQAKNAHEDPIVAFYNVYNSLDKYCKNNDIETYFANFNLIYGTDYKNLQDFLLKNNLIDESEWKTYVANVLIEEKEETLYGSSALGR